MADERGTTTHCHPQSPTLEDTRRTPIGPATTCIRGGNRRHASHTDACPVGSTLGEAEWGGKKVRVDGRNMNSKYFGHHRFISYLPNSTFPIATHVFEFDQSAPKGRRELPIHLRLTRIPLIHKLLGIHGALRMSLWFSRLRGCSCCSLASKEQVWHGAHSYLMRFLTTGGNRA